MAVRDQPLSGITIEESRRAVWSATPDPSFHAVGELNGLRRLAEEVPHEVGKPTSDVGHDEVDVIAHHYERVEEDSIALEFVDEQIEQDRIDRSIGTKEVVVVVCLLREEVDRAREDSAKTDSRSADADSRGASRKGLPLLAF